MSTSDGKKIQTQPLDPSTAPNHLYLVVYLHWVWHESFEIRRAKLLDVLSRLNDQMASSSNNSKIPLKYLFLANETVLLEDVAAVRPDLMAMMVIYNAGGRLGIGPWYTTVDDKLLSGESLVRNLLAARHDAARHGLNLMPVLYTERYGGHSAHLPQILHGFDVDAVFLTMPNAEPFRWEAPDGNGVLAIPHHSAKHKNEAELWLLDVGQSERSLTEIVKSKSKASITQGHLQGYTQSVRDQMPDNARPAHRGELRPPPLRDGVFLYPGTTSNRIYLKQANAHLQTYLTHAVEPWLTIALTHGDITYAENQQALLNNAWRLLLRNQSRRLLGGLGEDAVHEEAEIRSRQIRDLGEHVARAALDNLAGKLHPPSQEIGTDMTYIVVWNPHNWPVRQMVEVEITLPPGKHPKRLLSPENEEIIFGWQPAAGAGGKLVFTAEPPGVGYAAYTLHLAMEPPPEHHFIRITPGSVIGSPDGDTIAVQNNTLRWQRKHNGSLTVIDDLLNFYDGGDAGDAYNYSPPEPDLVVKADLAGDTHVESSSVYERLIFRHRMRVASALRVDRSRDRGLRLVELRTTATFYDHVPGVHFQTRFVNLAKDHRLRVHLHTGIRADRVVAGSAYGLVERAAHLKGDHAPAKSNQEGISNTHPARGVVSVGNMDGMIALLTRGLPEYQAIPEDDQTTLALTLLRSVGWLSRGDLLTRTAPAAPMIATPDAQCLREITADYALYSLPAADPAALLRARAAYTSPLQVYQYAEHPERNQRSYLSVISDRGLGDHSDGKGAILEAMKPPERGQGWIVRFYNPLETPVELFVTPFKQPDTVQRVSLAENVLYYLETDANGRVQLQIDPHELLTLRFNFA